jgi:hypothetical protein
MTTNPHLHRHPPPERPSPPPTLPRQGPSMEELCCRGGCWHRSSSSTTRCFFGDLFRSLIWARVWGDFFGGIIAGVSVSLSILIPQEIRSQCSRIWSFPQIVLHLGLARFSETGEEFLIFWGSCTRICLLMMWWGSGSNVLSILLFGLCSRNSCSSSRLLASARVAYCSLQAAAALLFLCFAIRGLYVLASNICCFLRILVATIARPIIYQFQLNSLAFDSFDLFFLKFFSEVQL